MCANIDFEQVQKIGQAKVVHDIYVKGMREAWIESIWSDGKLLAWAGNKVFSSCPCIPLFFVRHWLEKEI